MTLSRLFNTEEYSYEPFKTNSKGTCFQRTLARVPGRALNTCTGLTVSVCGGGGGQEGGGFFGIFRWSESPLHNPHTRISHFSRKSIPGPISIL